MLIPQDTILDVERFVDEITSRRVAVMQVVPSYLEVVATFLEHRGRELPDLRIVSATGEALKFDIVARWFAVAPGIPLVNAYGLTETSDDTNHEVLREAPADRRISLGPAVRNVRVYVVDPDLEPVPLGAPGLIAFSGVCVGRGYINDPVRTQQCYLTDPHKPGTRLYLGGDYGRWLPDGKLEFLGRRDSQVKIRGFRIEIGEIDNALLLVPGVRDAAVVVAERDDGSKHLVAFYASGRPIPAEELAWRLGETLPDYMVPSAFHWQASLPLTPQWQDRHQDTAGVRGRDCRHGGRRRRPPVDGHREDAGRRVRQGPRRAGGAHQQAGQLLRTWRHVPHGREARDRHGPGGVTQGDHPAARPGRPGRSHRQRR